MGTSSFKGWFYLGTFVCSFYKYVLNIRTVLKSAHPIVSQKTVLNHWEGSVESLWEYTLGARWRVWPWEVSLRKWRLSWDLNALTGHGHGEEVGGSMVGAEGYILGQISICFCWYLSDFLHILQATENHDKDLKRKVIWTDHHHNKFPLPSVWKSP